MKILLFMILQNVLLWMLFIFEFSSFRYSETFYNHRLRQIIKPVTLIDKSSINNLFLRNGTNFSIISESLCEIFFSCSYG